MLYMKSKSMSKKKKIHPRSQFQNFSEASLSEVKEQVNKWEQDNPDIQILNRFTKPVTNDINEGAKWFEIEIEYLK